MSIDCFHRIAIPHWGDWSSSMGWKCLRHLLDLGHGLRRIRKTRERGEKRSTQGSGCCGSLVGGWCCYSVVGGRVVGAFSRCSSHVPKKAAFRIPRDVPGQSCVQVSATIRNLLMKAIKIYNHKMKHENKPDGTSKHHKEHKEAKLPDSSWDDMTWYIPDPEHGDANLNEVFHHPAVQEYVQSEDFVNYIYAKLGNERAIGDQLVLGLIRLFQYLGPIDRKSVV